MSNWDFLLCFTTNCDTPIFWPPSECIEIIIWEINKINFVCNSKNKFAKLKGKITTI